MNVRDSVSDEQSATAEPVSADCCNRQPEGSEQRSAANGASSSRLLKLAAGDNCEEAIYQPIWQLAARIFQADELERLVPRQRSARSTSTEIELPLLDPLAFTETVAFEFLARGGKQARPFIFLATYAATAGRLDCVDGDGLEIPDQVQRVALSIETFHKASLVHDDIEDGDEYRYGQPTLHRRYGIASAINVGDYLIGLGYRLVSRDAAALGAEVAAELLDILAAAHQRLCEGQGAELFWRDALSKQLRPSDALTIYALKTSPAFEAALLCGARLHGPLGKLAEPLRRFSRHIGIAFQILNDLKDWSREEGNKKTIGGDLLGGRPTVLWALALERLPATAQANLMNLANDRELSDSARMEQARNLYLQADVFAAARKLVLEQRAAAAAAASDLPEGALQRLLLYIIETVLDRPHELLLSPAAVQGGATAGAVPSLVAAPGSVS